MLNEEVKNIKKCYAHTLYIKEYYFFSIAVSIFRSDYVFAPVIEFGPVDDESVIIAGVSFHVFNTLP